MVSPPVAPWCALSALSLSLISVFLCVHMSEANLWYHLSGAVYTVFEAGFIGLALTRLARLASGLCPASSVECAAVLGAPICVLGTKLRSFMLSSSLLFLPLCYCHI